MLRRQLIDVAIGGRPYEVCGLLGGWNGAVKTFHPIPNIAATPETRFVLAPDAFLRAYYAIERAGDELVAVFHSHPNHPPVPSATDIAEATWPDVFMVIAGWVGSEPRLDAWSIRTRQAIPVNVVID